MGKKSHPQLGPSVVVGRKFSEESGLQLDPRELEVAEPGNVVSKYSTFSVNASESSVRERTPSSGAPRIAALICGKLGHVSRGW
jgi:hypothetical protein